MDVLCFYEDFVAQRHTHRERASEGEWGQQGGNNSKINFTHGCLKERWVAAGILICPSARLFCFFSFRRCGGIITPVRLTDRRGANKHGNMGVIWLLEAPAVSRIPHTRRIRMTSLSAEVHSAAELIHRLFNLQLRWRMEEKNRPWGSILCVSRMISAFHFSKHTEINHLVM